MWRVEYSKKFLKELSRLPKTIQVQTEKVVFDSLLSANSPFELGYVEQMSGYPDKYKIRVGRYRIGITIDKNNKTLFCQRIAHRKDIYKVFP